MKKHVFSGLYIYKLDLPEPANSQNEERKRFLHGLCSSLSGKMGLLQAVQIQLRVWRLCWRQTQLSLDGSNCNNT